MKKVNLITYQRIYMKYAMIMSVDTKVRIGLNWMYMGDKMRKKFFSEYPRDMVDIEYILKSALTKQFQGRDFK